MFTHRDGFHALYRIATQVIPVLNNKSMPFNPPKYDGCKDIFEYKKLSKNYWVLKLIKIEVDTEEIETSEVFNN